MPPVAIWASLLPALIAVGGALLGVVVTSWTNRRRERDHYVWQRRCDLYLRVLKDITVVEDVIDEKSEPRDLYFEDENNFTELLVFSTEMVSLLYHDLQGEYREWQRFHEAGLRRYLHNVAGKDLHIRYIPSLGLATTPRETGRQRSREVADEGEAVGPKSAQVRP